MKKYFKFMAFAIMVVFSLAFASCDKDNDDIDPTISDSGAPGAEPGTLVGNDAEANTKVEGLRVASFGGYRYTYDENGKLETISVGDYYTASAKDNFKITDIWGDGDYYYECICTFNIANNHIISASYSINYREMYPSDDYDIGQATETTSYKYNSMGQLSSVTSAITEKGSYGGQDYTETKNVTITFTYSSDNRLIKMEQYKDYIVKDGERFTDTRVYQYDYSRSYENKFYQYTPQLLGAVPDDYVDAFAYVGLLGKASSALPGKYVETTKYDSSTSGTSDPSSYTETCYYSFNSDGTIRSAGSDEYTYTNIGTRSAFETATPAWHNDGTKVGRQPRRGLMRSLRERHQRYNMK